MNFIERNIPSYFYKKSNLIYLVLFTALFALFFIILYEPFNSSEWYNISKFEYFLYSSLLILVGVLFVVISRFFMYFYVQVAPITYLGYAIWILIEIIFMAALYALISYILDGYVSYTTCLEDSLINTALILLLPYFIMHLYFAFQEKNRQLQQLKDSANLLNEHVHERDIISFSDTKGELRLSIKTNTLLYIEPADNYLEIWYIGQHGVTNYLLRNTLNNIEEKFVDTNIIRCHRSYMVNFDQVKVAKKTKNGIFLDLGIEKVPEIPVSKSYGEKVTKWLISSMD